MLFAHLSKKISLSEEHLTKNNEETRKKEEEEEMEAENITCTFVLKCDHLLEAHGTISGT